MSRRALISTALIEQDNPILDLDGKSLTTERGVRGAVQRVSKDLHDMFVARGYSGGGWAIVEPDGGENGITFQVVEGTDDYGKPSGEFVVVGVMEIQRD